MRNYLLVVFLSIIIPFTACKQNEKETDKKFISVLALIKKEVAHIDTSLYSIMKVVYTDSLHIDTTYIRREQFADAAKDFLSIPDLSDKKIAKRFTEESPRYDEQMNRVIFTYLPLKPDNEEFKKQELLLTPIPGEESKVNNVIITREIANRDSFFQQRMLWQTAKSFQIVTRRQKPGQPEITTTTKVTWNEGLIQ